MSSDNISQNTQLTVISDLESSKISSKMSKLELKASSSLATIFAFRMLGLFLILPIFAVYAQQLTGGDNKTLVGIALGAYGLSQAVFQIPYGWLSDRFGRKLMIYIGLIIFAIGSFYAMMAHDIIHVIIGRLIQGAGAIAAVLIALTADLTREEHRTKAMAMIGISIGVTFSISLVLGPALNSMIGISGIFGLTGLLALSGIYITKYIVPDVPKNTFSRPPFNWHKVKSDFKTVLHNPNLIKLDISIFVLHAVLTSIFISVPFLLKNAGLVTNNHWHVYLPVMLVSFVLMTPVIIFGEKKQQLKIVLLSAIALMLVGILSLLALHQSILQISIGLTLFFWAFNILEASLPSLVSKISPSEHKGSAIGIYNTAEFFGAFLGGALGGFLAHHLGLYAVLIFDVILIAFWLHNARNIIVPIKKKI